MSYRKQDMKAEQELALFLEKNLYAELRKEGEFSSIRRADSGEQIKGIDVLMTYKDIDAYIDEKASLHYLNRNLPTFAFELSYQSHGEERIGWFLNDRLKTTHYLLLWPNAKTSDFQTISKDDFTWVDALLIDKANLKEYLGTIGLDDNTLLECVGILRKRDVDGRQDIPQDGISISVSKKYSEKPINLVIRKSILREIAEAHYLITQDGFIRKK